MRQPAYVTALAFLMLVAPGHAQEDHGSLPDRPASFVAATRAFAFYSDPVLNLHERADANPRVVWIGLANGSEAEAVMATELRALMRRHNLEPWILTRRVLIDENQISHSHPILTISTGHLGEELELLSTFVHEQLHWLEEEPWRDDFWAAMRDFEALFPDVPSSADGGARDDRSTYRHLLVCDMEYQALTALVGEVAARKTLAGITHYEWIYEKVLNDPRVREVAVRHGFDVSDGVPRQ